MIDRNRKLRFIQFILLIFGLLIIYLTYYNKTIDDMDKIVSETLKKSVEESSPDNKETFSNIEYTGLDLNGNRYLLKSEQAYLDEINKEIVIKKLSLFFLTIIYYNTLFFSITQLISFFYSFLVYIFLYISYIPILSIYHLYIKKFDTI